MEAPEAVKAVLSSARTRMSLFERAMVPARLPRRYLGVTP